MARAKSLTATQRSRAARKANKARNRMLSAKQRSEIARQAGKANKGKKRKDAA
jgi:hypothetical protein